VTSRPSRAAITGIAFSPISRRSDRSIGSLTVETAKSAIADAGLQVADIDGLSTYPNPSRNGAGNVDGRDFVDLDFVARSLRLKNLRWSTSITRGTVVAATVEAVNAVLAGACSTVLVWRSMYNPPGRFGQISSPVARDSAQFDYPYGLMHIVINHALPYSRYMSTYGLGREDMGSFIVRNRVAAAANPESVFRGSPITLDDYLSSRMIAEPLSLLDCDMPVTGCGALVVTSGERAQDLPAPPAYVVGQASLGLRYHSGSIWRLEEMAEGARLLGDQLWGSSGLSASEVDQVNVYDGISYLVCLWLEGLRFCEAGGALDYLKDLSSLAAGKWSVNANGGALGMGRLHGTPQLIEAVRQVQGRAGASQVDGAAVTLANAGTPVTGSAAMLFSAA
jgi:acetyl-CoA acetyltransferase